VTVPRLPVDGSLQAPRGGAKSPVQLPNRDSAFGRRRVQYHCSCSVCRAYGTFCRPFGEVGLAKPVFPFYERDVWREPLAVSSLFIRQSHFLSTRHEHDTGCEPTSVVAGLHSRNYFPPTSTVSSDRQLLLAGTTGSG
jgi:hypothetical protein